MIRLNFCRASKKLGPEMIMEISFNETTNTTRTLEAALENVRVLLEEQLHFSQAKDLSVLLITKMYGGCDILSLTVGGDTLKIRRIDGH